MVWLELALASKGAGAFGPAVLKLASAGSSATGIAIATPPDVLPQVLAAPDDVSGSLAGDCDASHVGFIAKSMSSLIDGIITGVSSWRGTGAWSNAALLTTHNLTAGQGCGPALLAVTATASGVHGSPLADRFAEGQGPICFTAGAMAVLQYLGYFGEPQDVVGRVLVRTPMTPLLYTFPAYTTRYLVATANCFMAGALVQSTGVYLPMSWRTLAECGLLLPFLTFPIMDRVAARNSMRWAWAVDVGLDTFSYLFSAHMLNTVHGVNGTALILYWVAVGACVRWWEPRVCHPCSVICMSVLLNQMALQA